MEPCRHTQLVLLPPEGKRLRCRHCHLTIKSADLVDKYCPECFETTGKRRRDFEEVPEKPQDTTQYRCEDCGIVISCP